MTATSVEPGRLPMSGLTAPIPAQVGAAQLNTRIFSQASPPLSAEDLPLGPGDLIEVSVFEVPELSNIKARIPLTGQISYPLIGALRAAGRTPGQLQEDIRTRLQDKYMHDPQVSVFVVEQRAHRISVLGAVRKGGAFTFTGPLRLADALAMAEGLAENADHILYLTRRAPPESGVAQAMTVIDLEDLARGNDGLNVELQAGDVIHVPAAGSFYVGGEVEKPGTFLLKGRTTLDQAIVAAGGLRNVAEWSDVRIYRAAPDGSTQVMKYDINDIEAGRPAPEILRNDVVLVGKSGRKSVAYGLLDFFKSIINIGVGVSRGY